MKRLGFIGAGNMGRAILSGALYHGILKESEIIVSAKTKKSLDALTAMHSDLTCTLDNRQVARESEIVYWLSSRNIFMKYLRISMMSCAERLCSP